MQEHKLVFPFLYIQAADSRCAVLRGLPLRVALQRLEGSPQYVPLYHRTAFLLLLLRKVKENTNLCKSIN